ncbi:small integral membrane protein 20 isoform X2 [Latimeria chalumnae]|uniref:small integral membrane protein 20 isoform X2 n=1 Tax=Latimeria chalumnae TaxID=7897 RepID=UPI00313E602A
MSKNARAVLLFGGFVAAVGAAFYPIFFHPFLHVEEYTDQVIMNRRPSWKKKNRWLTELE